MRGVLTIAKKELARFFSSKASAAVAILLPGLMIYGVWSIMGDAMRSMVEGDGGNEPARIEVAEMPASVDALLRAEFAVSPVDGAEASAVSDAAARGDDAALRERMADGGYAALAVFPEGFDEAVAEYDPASGERAPQVAIYYDSSDGASLQAYGALAGLLDAYESSLSNRFDVNAGEGRYDVADDRDAAASLIASLIPMLLLILLFSGCMSVAAESIAGEKERGTMATLLATPVGRGAIAFGKVAALGLVGLMVAASSALGIFAALPNLAGGGLEMGVYGAGEYLLLALVIASTALLVVALIAIVSALAKTTKEAQLYLTPLMVIVMAVGLLGMFGEGAQADLLWYFVPLYNSVQCMVGIFSFDLPVAHAVACVASNLAWTALGVAALRRMFDSERLMFAR